MANMICVENECVDTCRICEDCEYYKAVYDPKIYKLVPIGEESEPCKEAEPWTRQRVLKEAEKCVCGEREQDYGTPEDNFDRIAKMCSAYMGVEFNPVDVSMFMVMLKVARIKSGGGTMDSFVDGCGYFSCGGEIFARNMESGERV